MNNELEPLKASFLTAMEFGQLMHRHLSDLRTIDPALLTDQPYNAYLQQINVRLISYEKGIAQVRKSEETEKISLADKARDKAIAAFSAALKLYHLSDDPAEVDASRILGILNKNFKNLAKLNYEAESIAIDKLLSELESFYYADKVTFLNIGRYVTRMKTSNEQFKTLFGGRMVTEALTETYDMRAMRSAMLAVYNEFTAYILVMSKAIKTPLFISALLLLNSGRKYYADLLARRKTDKPTTPTKDSKNL